MVGLQLEVGHPQFGGPRVGLDVVLQVVLVSVHEGEQSTDQSLHARLGLTGETLPYAFGVLGIEHLLVLGIDLFLFHVDIPEELINIHVILGVAIMFRKTSQTPLTSACSTTSIDTHELYRLLSMIWLMTAHFLTNG